MHVENRKKFAFSLSSHGSAKQFAVAVALLAFIPPLILGYILVLALFEKNPPLGMIGVLLGFVVLLVALGIALLVKYPINIIRLRQHIETLAHGAVPGEMKLIDGEDDLTAIERYMNEIIRQTEERIRTIERQSKALLQAERQRVMIESLGAVCHHLGQPLTIINAYLHMARQREQTPAVLTMLNDCQEAAEAIAGLLEKLRNLSDYQSEPYIHKETGRKDEGPRILSIP